MLLEEFAERRVANAQFLRNLLNGERIFQRFSDTQTGFINHVNMLGILAQYDISFQRIHFAYQMVYDTRHSLLCKSSLFLCGFVSLFVESDNLVTVTYMVDWLFRRKKTCLHAVVDVLALEANPIAFPSLGA